MNDKTIVANGSKAPDTYIADLDFGFSKESLLKMWKMLESKIENKPKGYKGLLIFGTTGGLDTNCENFKELFFKPKGYNTASYNDVWDIEILKTENTVTNSGTTSKIYFKPVNSK